MNRRDDLNPEDLPTSESSDLKDARRASFFCCQQEAFQATTFTFRPGVSPVQGFRGCPNKCFVHTKALLAKTFLRLIARGIACPASLVLPWWTAARWRR